MPTVSQERIDRTLDFKQPTFVKREKTKRGLEKHEVVPKETMKKLKDVSYRLHPKLYKISKNEAEWNGHKKDQNRIRSLQDNLEGNTKINIPKNEKRKIITSGIHTILILVYRELSAKTYIHRKLLNKQKEWI